MTKMSLFAIIIVLINMTGIFKFVETIETSKRNTDIVYIFRKIELLSGHAV